MRALTAPFRMARLCTSFGRRMALAVRFHLQLGYSWHLAWIKAERA